MTNKMISFKELKNMVDDYCINESRMIPSDNTLRNWLKRKNKKDKFKHHRDEEDEELKAVYNEKRGNKSYFSFNESKKMLTEHGILLSDSKEKVKAHNKKMLNKLIELKDSFDEDDPSTYDQEVMKVLSLKPDFNIDHEIEKIHTNIIYKMILDKLGGYEWFDDMKIKEDIYFSLASDETKLNTRQYLARQRLKKLSKRRYLIKGKKQ